MWMRSERILAAAGSLSFHGLCIAGFFYWNTGLPVSEASASDPAPTFVEPTRVSSPTAETVTPAAPSPDTASSADSAVHAIAPRVLLKLPKNPAGGEENGQIVEGSYSWPDGEKRKKVSGPMPRPLNAGRSQAVKLDLAVSPNGTVHSIKVVEPAGTGFEREAARVLRRWRFEVLPRAKPQRDQRCVVTLRIKQ
jgi:TonB family protein